MVDGSADAVMAHKPRVDVSGASNRWRADVLGVLGILGVATTVGKSVAWPYCAQARGHGMVLGLVSLARPRAPSPYER